jgi:hypothetical protein
MAAEAERRTRANGTDVGPLPSEDENRTSPEPHDDQPVFFDPWADPPPPEFPGGILTREMEDTVFALAMRDGVCPGALAMAFLRQPPARRPKPHAYAAPECTGRPIVWVG